jgi:hypothetical protein
MRSAVQVESLVTVFLVFSITDYLQYRAIRDLRRELAQSQRTGRVRGYLLGGIGMVLFLALGQLLVVLSLLGAHPGRWAGPGFVTAIGLLLVGFVIKSQQVGRIRRKHRRDRNRIR